MSVQRAVAMNVARQPDTGRLAGVQCSPDAFVTDASLAQMRAIRQ